MRSHCAPGPTQEAVGRRQGKAASVRNLGRNSRQATEHLYGSRGVEVPRLRGPDLAASDELGSEVSFPRTRYTH